MYEIKYQVKCAVRGRVARERGISMAARTLQELVAAAASLHPDRAAVTYDGGSVSGSPGSLLYRDLAELAGELSHILRKTCSPNNGVIGLYCWDDLFTPVWILG